MTGKKHDMRYSCFLPWWYEILLLWVSFFCRGTPGDEENWVFREALLRVYSRKWGRVRHFCRSALLWTVKADSYRKFFNTCRGTILSLVLATIEWLIIMALRAFFFIRNLRQIARNFRKVVCACDRCWQGWKRLAPLRYLRSARGFWAAQLLRKQTSLRSLSLPLRFLNSPLRFLKVLIFIEACNSFQSTLEF